MGYQREGVRIQRNGIWQIDVSVGGRRVQRSSGTTSKTKALAMRDKIRSELWDEIRLGVKRESSHTWDDAVAEYIGRARKRKNRALNDVRQQLAFLQPHMAGPLDSSVAQRARAALAAKEKAGVVRMIRGEWRRVRDVSPTTINRYSATISAVLNVARERGWIRVVPVMERSAEEPRVEFLTRPQWDALRAKLPAHLVPLASFALATGQRQKVVTHLAWREVSLEQRCLILPAERMKNGKPLRVPLSADAMAILQGQAGKSDVWVFPWERSGRPVEQPAGLAWRKALMSAGLPRTFRWHSLRSTWVVWHLEAGTPLEVVMRLGGWRRIDVLIRHYAHFSKGLADRFVDNSLGVLPVREVSAGCTQTEIGAL